MTPEVDVNRLFESLATMEEQREILGASVDPLIAEIRGQIMEQTPKPTDDQRRVAESWQSVLATSEELGLEAPSATDDIAEAVTAVENYGQLMARLGGTGLTETVEEPVPKKAAARAPKPKTTTPKPDVPKEQPPRPEVIVDIDSLDNVVGDVVIVGGKRDSKPAEATKQMYVDIFRELADSPDGSFETTAFVRKITGGLSSRDLQLIEKGEKKAPTDTDLIEAGRKCDQFYGILKRLRNNHLLDHSTGSTKAVKGEFKHGTSGIVRSFGDIKFLEDEDGTLRIEVEAKPYDVKINTYAQTIDNGHDKELRLDTNEEIFLTISKAIGSIALSSEENHARFTRSDLVKWIMDDHNLELNASEQTRLTGHLIDLIGDFKRDFPLLNHGIKGGAHFSWETGTNVETIDGWPEKPRFNEAVRISIGTDNISITIDNEQFELINYSVNSSGLENRGINISQLMERNRALFEALACMSETDSISTEDVYNMIYDPEASDAPDKAVFTTWFRQMAGKLNGIGNEKIVNWNKRGTTIDVDLNRSFVVEETGEPASPKAEKGGAPRDATPSPSNESSATPESEVDEEESVKPRLTPTEAAEAIGRLDENTKAQISGRLIRHGAFDYPKNLAEAAYLLSLMSNDTVLAEVREGAFHHKDVADYKAFVAEVLFSCYLRTKSWGSFEDLSAAITKLEDGTTSKLVKRHINHFERTTDAAVESIWSDEDRTEEKLRDRKYAESVLEHLLAGSLPKPRSAIQGIILLDTFKENRAEISKSMGKPEFEKLVQDMHDAVASKKVLGGNALTALESRQGPYAHRSNRHGGVVQTAGEASKDTVMSRTDLNRRPGGRRSDNNGNGSNTAAERRSQRRSGNRPSTN